MSSAQEDVKLEVMLFGVLIDAAGADRLQVEDVGTVADLVSKLESRYPSLKKYHYLIAVNEKIAKDDSTIKKGDEVAFLPPFSGG